MSFIGFNLGINTKKGGFTFDEDFLTYYNAGVTAGFSMPVQNQKATSKLFKKLKSIGAWDELISTQGEASIFGAWNEFGGIYRKIIGVNTPTSDNFTTLDYDTKLGLKGNVSNETVWRTNAGFSDYSGRQNDNHAFVFFSTATTTANNGCYIGTGGLSGNFDLLASTTFGGSFASSNMGVLDSGAGSPVNSIGMIRSASGEFTAVVDNTAQAVTSGASGTPSTNDFTLFSVIDESEPGSPMSFFSDARILFYSVGGSLTLSQMSQLRSALVVYASELTYENVPLNASIVYAMPTATGDNDGTSWENAFTNFKTAYDSLSAGQYLLTSAPETNQFSRPAAFNPNPANITWISNVGPHKETWITGGDKLSWTDATGGVWSADVSALDTVEQVAYDFKRDDNIGTVTGINVNQYSSEIEALGFTVADAVAWYGFLVQSDPATTTPAEGEWSVVSDVLYINPPGSPVKAVVDNLSIVGSQNNLMAWGAGSQLTNFTHKGKLTLFFSPSPSGANGYSMRFENSLNNNIQDVRSIMSGYHSIGFVNSNKGQNKMRNCLTVGEVSTTSGGGLANPYVFYSNNAFVDSDQSAENMCFIAFPELGTDGAPIVTEYSPRLGYSHTDGSVSMNGIRWDNWLLIDYRPDLDAEHSTSLSVTVAPITMGNTGISTTSDLATRQLGRIQNGKSFGAVALPPNSAYTFNNKFNALGHSDNTEEWFDFAAPIPTPPNYSNYIENCDILAGNLKEFAGRIKGTDKLYYKNCNFYLKSTATYPTAFGSASTFDADAVTFEDCFFHFVGDWSFSSYNAPTGWQDSLDIFRFVGDNRVSRDCQTGVRRSNPEVTPETIEFFKDNVNGGDNLSITSRAVFSNPETGTLERVQFTPENPVTIVTDDTLANNGSSTTSCVVTKPTNLAEGNLIVVVIGARRTANGATVSYTIPSGFTEQADTFDLHPNSVKGQANVFTKIATGSEPASYTFTASGTVNYRSYAYRVTGHDASVPIDVDRGNNNGATNSTSISVGAIKTNFANSTELLILGLAGTISALSLPAGFTIVNESNTDPYIMIASRVVSKENLSSAPLSWTTSRRGGACRVTIVGARPS